MSRTADSLTLPTAMHSSGNSGRGAAAESETESGPSLSGRIRRWVTSRNADSSSQHQHRSQHRSGRTNSAERGAGGDGWWKIHFFRGMVNDVRRRAPYYWSDWRDAWDYRVVPSTIYMYFAKYARLEFSALIVFSFLVFFLVS